MTRRFLGLASVTILAGSVFSQLNPHAATVAEFQSRVADYMILHKKAQAELPLRPTKSAHAIAQRQVEFAKRIRAARVQAKQGDLFTPAIAAEFRRLVQIAMGAEAKRIQTSLKRAEPVHAAIEVNRSYPANLPLQSTPPSLLANLPALPPGLDYRVVGKALVLRDVEANLIVDFVPDAIS